MTRVALVTVLYGLDGSKKTDTPVAFSAIAAGYGDGSIVATIARADDWQYIESFARAKEDWFRKFIPLSNGVPSQDTFEQIFKQIDPKIFLQCFMEWTQMVAAIVKGGIIAIDGKTMRGSHAATYGKCLV
jgi:hypothetical protein